MKRTDATRRALSVLTAGLLLAVTMPVAPATAAESELLTDKYQLFGTAAQDEFGTSVAVWGDTAIVGAPHAEGDRGAAYILGRSGHAWLVRQTLTAPHGAPGDGFGYSVALNGDTAVIGAPYDDQQDTHAGAAYIFVENGDSWAVQDKLTADNGAAYDWFGSAVTLWGDTALIGAPYVDGPAPGPGSAYVFTRSGSDWLQRTELEAPHGGTPADGFGFAVALEGDVALIGSFGDDEKGADAGAVYVLSGSGGAWAVRDKLTADDGGADDWFGMAVAIWDGMVLIGAPFDDEQDTNAGAAYVFVERAREWSGPTKLTAADGGVGDSFGCSVALSGGAALVGAYMAEGMKGAAYLFTGAGYEWSQRRKVTDPEGGSVGWMGRSVGLSGGNAVVGAPFETTPEGAALAGSALVYSFRHPLTPGVTRIAGTNRYLTAVAASERGFPAGAPAVVVATGQNWPDALGGSALAGAAYGPLLLTRKDVLPEEVAAEIQRLGAVKAYVLGSTAAVGSAVEQTLATMLGRANVVRLGGANRYETARLVAEEVIRLPGSTSQGGVFVATGLNYPDATAASPLAAWQGMPILLANVRAGTVPLPAWASRAIILGSEAAVPRSVYNYLVARLGSVPVVRLGGANRYETAAIVAAGGVQGGMHWDGAGLATGTNFPDALASGPMLATNDSVLLLTRPKALPGETAAKLRENEAAISSMFIFGDNNAVSAGVEAQVRAAAGLPGAGL